MEFNDPARDDLQVAHVYRSVLDEYTNDRIIYNLPEEVKDQLFGWMNNYLTRREIEAAVSPISPRIVELHLDVWDLKWKHRISQSELRAYDNIFEALKMGETNHVTVSAKSINDINTVINSMRKYGWEVKDVFSKSGDYANAARFGPHRQNYETLRRLLIAGLDQKEAISFYTTEIVEYTRWNASTTDYIIHNKYDTDQVERLADTLGISSEAVREAVSEAKNKLKDIDPTLPDVLTNKRGGRPLPDEMLSDFDHEVLRWNSGEEPY